MPGTIYENYSIAGLPFSLSGISDRARGMLREYVTDAPPVFSVSLSSLDIDNEIKNFGECGDSRTAAPDRSSFESLALCRKFSEAAIRHGLVLFHGSAVAVDGRAYIFTAPSGTGKSTHSRLWMELLGDRAFVVNDDKPFIRFDNGGVSVCGSPWNGKHRLSKNVSVPLAGIAFLSRCESNSIVRISGDDRDGAFIRLFRQTYRPSSPDSMKITLEYISEIVRRIPLFDLKCNISEEAAELSYSTMKRSSVDEA